MERPRLVPQLYGYAVCLVSVITILIASSNIVEGAFDAAAPEMSREVEFGLGSFEAYREQQAQRPTRVSPDAPPAAGTAAVERVPEETLRARYESERVRRIASVRYHAWRRIVSSGLMLLIAGALFATHWRWLRGHGQDAA